MWHPDQSGPLDSWMCVENGLYRNSKQRFRFRLDALRFSTAVPESLLAVKVPYITHSMPERVAVRDFGQAIRVVSRRWLLFQITQSSYILG